MSPDAKVAFMYTRYTIIAYSQIGRKSVRWLGWSELEKGVNAQHTASKPSTAPSMMRQQSIHVPLFHERTQQKEIAGDGRKSKEKGSTEKRKDQPP